MGVPTSEVGYTSATAGVWGTRKSERTCGGIGKKNDPIIASEFIILFLGFTLIFPFYYFRYCYEVSDDVGKRTLASKRF